MLNISLRDKFLEEHADNCMPDELYRHFKYYYDKYQTKNTDGVENLNDCLWYLKRLLTRNNPKQVYEVVCKVHNLSFNLMQIETVYIYHIRLVALLSLHYSEYSWCAHWAKKALELASYFDLHFKNEKENSALNFYYEDCRKLFDENEQYFDAKIQKDWVFEWEQEMFSLDKIANENSNELITV